MIQEPSEENFRGLDIVLGAAESDIARLYAPEVVRAGAVFVDNSSAYRIDVYKRQLSGFPAGCSKPVGEKLPLGFFPCGGKIAK